MKGAVLFGFQNNIIRKRKAKYTLGIQMHDDWKEKFQGKGIKDSNTIEKCAQCSNLFSKLITRNDYVEFDKVIWHSYKALIPNPEIVFFKKFKRKLYIYR